MLTPSGAHRADILDRVDAYLDAVPREDAQVVDVGEFTLFVSRGPWPYYARPARDHLGPIGVADVLDVIATAAEYDLEAQLEWVHDLRPELLESARGGGLVASLHPLLVYSGDRSSPHVPTRHRVRLLDIDADGVDADLGAARAVTEIAFSGLVPDQPGLPPLDHSDRALAAAMARAGRADHVAHVKRRLRSGQTIMAVAEDENGIVAAGSVQPVDGVRDRYGAEFAAAEVVGIGTLPSARRKGLGAAITSLLTDVALSRGASIVMLSAADEATAGVYRNVGYVDVGHVGAAGLAGHDTAVE